MTTETTSNNPTNYYWAETLSDAADALGLTGCRISWTFREDYLGSYLDLFKMVLFPLSANRERYDRTSDKITFTFYIFFSKALNLELPLPGTFSSTSDLGGPTIFITNIEPLGDFDYLPEFSRNYTPSDDADGERGFGTLVVAKKITAISYPRRDGQ